VIECVPSSGLTEVCRCLLGNFGTLETAWNLYAELQQIQALNQKCYRCNRVCPVWRPVLKGKSHRPGGL
jgi:hypothetical protein